MNAENPSAAPSPAPSPDDDLLVWLDMEMSGLDPDRDRILEAAILITDGGLNLVAEGPDLILHEDAAVLSAMDDWNREHHGASGLSAAVLASSLSLEKAEEELLAFVSRFVKKGKAPLCGNSIGQDRRFLHRHMPTLHDHFHYRNVDVSTVKELARRWYPALPPFKKAEAHRALDDIRESLAELRYYRKHIFLP